MTKEISNSDDIIDSRDVIARIEELQSEREALKEKVEAAHQAHAGGVSQDVVDAVEELAQWDSDYGAELKALEALANEAEGYIADWKYGEALIRDSYFEDYAQELADDIGAVNSDATWPNNCIDWERAARELQRDYTAIDFDGVTYWAR